MSSPSFLCVPYRYKAGTLYSQVPSSGLGDFTVTRTTSPENNLSTRVNAQGFIETVADNVPRLDYPLGGIANGCPALLVEPSAQNLLFYSEEFNDGYWFKNTTTVQTNAAISPRNTLTADNIYPSSTGADRRFQRAVPVASGTTYTFSIFAKANGLNWIRFSSPQFNLFAWFNVQSGTIGSFQAGLTAKIENYGNGWYRCSVTQTATSTTTGQFYINPTDGDNTSNVTASGTNGVLFWGAQGEIGSVASSYIPTTNQSITRGVETISKTGVSSLIGQTEGTLYAEIVAQPYNNALFPSILEVDDGADTQRFAIFVNSVGGIRVRFNASGVNTNMDSTNPATLVVGQTYKIAAAFGFNGSQALYIDGVFQASGSVTAGPFTAALNRVMLGHRDSIVSPFLIRAAAIYPTRIPNTAPLGVLSLQSLTQ